MRRLSAFALALFLIPAAAGATPILIDPGAELAGNAAALAAFNRAAASWGSLFSDPITVTISANLVNLGATNIIGQTGSVMLGANYSFIRNQIVADAADEPSNAIVAALPTASQVSAFLPAGFSLADAIYGTKANLKAMGFEGLDAAFGASDAEIDFNSNFAFDFDRSDGVGAGLVDFETVATHEIGHALGFVSFVDEIDVAMALGLTGGAAFEPLDLFRFGSAAGFFPTTTAEFTTTPRMLYPGVESVFSDVASNIAMSTGQFFGDGRQASHWKDDRLTGLYIGVMDPTLASATVEQITAADIRALDLIGWDLKVQEVPVPEPASILLMAVGLVAVVRRKGARQQD